MRGLALGFVVVVAFTLLYTQVIVPAVMGTRYFPWFTRSRRTLNRRAEDLSVTEDEMRAANLERRRRDMQKQIKQIKGEEHGSGSVEE